MKRSLVVLTLIVGAFAALRTAAAEEYKDTCAVGPTHCKILKEDGKVRVFDYTAKAGDKVAMHSHPAHVLYIIQGGKAKFTAPDGSVKEIETKAGDAIINPPTIHSVEHLTDMHAIIVEMGQ